MYACIKYGEQNDYTTNIFIVVCIVYIYIIESMYNCIHIQITSRTHQWHSFRPKSLLMS